MAFEDDYTNDPAVTSALWNQYYGNVTTPDAIPSGFQFNQNQMIADALRGYDQNPYFTEATYMPGYEDTLTRKLLEKNAAGTTTTTGKSGGGMQMPNMDMMKSLTQNKSSNTSPEITPVGETEYAPFGGDTATTEYAPWGGDTAAVEYAPWGGDTAASSGAEYAPWGGDTAASASGGQGMFGNGGSLGGGWASAAGGALSGYMAGRENYQNDPNMWNKKDNFGTAHKDYRAEIGGGTLGGVMGYYGGPVGAALAGPTVKAVHPFMEKGTRGVINFGDKVGGAGGAMMLDPIGTAASGKYKWGDVIGGGLLGPAYNLFK